MEELVSKQAAIKVLDTIWGTVDKPENTIDDVYDYLKECFVALPFVPSDKSLWFDIGEICAEVSKEHITAEEGIVKIREKLHLLNYRLKAEEVQSNTSADTANKIVCTLDTSVPEDSACNYCCIHCPNMQCDERCPICKDTSDISVVYEADCVNAVY